MVVHVQQIMWLDHLSCASIFSISSRSFVCLHFAWLREWWLRKWMLFIVPKWFIHLFFCSFTHICCHWFTHHSSIYVCVGVYVFPMLIYNGLFVLPVHGHRPKQNEVFVLVLFLFSVSLNLVGFRSPSVALQRHVIKQVNRSILSLQCTTTPSFC